MSQRRSGLEELICKGTEEFTNTLSLLLAFGGSSLEKPRPLDFGVRLGMFVVENATLRGLETLSLRETPRTRCDDAVAEVVIPVNIKNVTVSIQWRLSRGSLVRMSFTGGTITASLNDVDLDLGLSVSRTDPERRAVISELEIPSMEGLDVQVQVLTPVLQVPTTIRSSRGVSPGEMNILKAVLRTGLQRFLDNGGLPI